MPTAHRRIAKSERKTPAGRSQAVDAIALLAKTASDADAPPAVKPEGQPVVEDQNIEADPGTRTALRAEVDAAFRQSADLRQAITDNLAPLCAKAAKASERVKKAFEDWNPVQLSEEDRNRGLYVPPDKDTTKTLKTVIESSVDAMRTADTGGAIRLRNSRELKRIIKHPRDGAGSAHGVVELGRLVDLLYSKRTAYSLVSNPVYTRCKAELDAEEVLSIVAKTAEEGTVDESTLERSAKARETAQYVKDSVHRQMDPATAPEAQFTYGTVAKIPNASNEDEEQKKLLSTFQLRPGPSDVTSYHDFHTLQIAFANVWTKLFDGELEALGRELYTNYVDLKEFTGSPDPDIKVSTLNDLRRLMAEIRKLSHFVQEDLPSSLRPESGRTTGGVTLKPGDVAKGAAAVATAGASLFIEWAINDLVKLGNRPVRAKWANFPLKLNEPKGNIIELQPPELNGAYPGTVEIVLETDANSYKKRIVFQQWDADTGRQIYSAEIQNFGAGHAAERGPTGTIVDRLLLNPAQLASGTLKFFSEDEILNEVLLGRYVLGDLPEVLKERTKVTFRWKGQR